ncbi:hypothetical protein GCM10009536_09850 [Streptomyces thermocarboxydus]
MTSVVVMENAPLASKELASAPCPVPFVRARVPGPAGAHPPAGPPVQSPHEPPPISPAARAQRYLAPSTATGFSVVYG